MNKVFGFVVLGSFLLGFSQDEKYAKAACDQLCRERQFFYATGIPCVEYFRLDCAICSEAGNNCVNTEANAPAANKCQPIEVGIQIKVGDGCSPLCMSGVAGHQVQATEFMPPLQDWSPAVANVKECPETLPDPTEIKG